MNISISREKFDKIYYFLYIFYALVPIAIGLDKCLTWLIVDWSIYVSPIFLPPLTADFIVKITGIFEIIAGLILLFRPRFGAYLVMVYLIVVVINLITIGNYIDIIARDLVIAVGYLTFAWFAEIKEQSH